MKRFLLWLQLLLPGMLCGVVPAYAAVDNVDYVRNLAIQYALPILVLLVVFLILSSLLLRYNTPAPWKNKAVMFLMVSTGGLLTAVMVVSCVVSFHAEEPLQALAFAFFLCLPFLVAGWFTLQSLLEVQQHQQKGLRNQILPEKEPTSV